MTYDIEIGQGDTDSIPAVLKENGVGFNLTGTTITFSLKNDLGSITYDITCLPGAIVNGVTVPFTEGGITIPFSSTETAASGLFFGVIKVNIFGQVKTFPNSEKLTVKIKRDL